MTSEASTTTDRQRKTLDDIRRELEVEFVDDPGEGVVDRPRGRLVDRMTPHYDVDDQLAGREADDERPSASPKRRGYVLAALVGCTVGQLLLLGFLLTSRNAVVSRGADITLPSQTVTSATVTSSPPPPAAEPSPVRNSTTASTAPVDSAQPSPTPSPKPVHVPLRG